METQRKWKTPGPIVKGHSLRDGVTLKDDTGENTPKPAKQQVGGAKKVLVHLDPVELHGKVRRQRVPRIEQSSVREVSGTVPAQLKVSALSLIILHL
jgi:hypothetical protein